MKLIVDCWRSAPSAGRRKLGGFEQYPDRNGDTCPERDADECREQTAAVETDSRIVTNGSDVGDSAVALGLAHLRNCVRIGDDSKFPSGEPPYPFEVLRLRRVSQGLRLPSCDFGTACEVNLPRTPFRSGAKHDGRRRALRSIIALSKQFTHRPQYRRKMSLNFGSIICAASKSSDLPCGVACA